MTPRAVTMLYDADCGLCTASAAWVVRRASPDDVRVMPLQGAAADAGVAMVVEGRDLASTLHVVRPDGTVQTGAAAVLRVARGVPRWRHVARLADNPAGRALLEPAYRLAVRRRHRIGRMLGLEQACAVPGRETLR